MTFTADPRKDSLESLELRDTDAKSLLVLAPSRGGMATRLSLGGRHRLFLDESTLREQIIGGAAPEPPRDPQTAPLRSAVFAKNVRGGIPVLFPSPGKLEGGVYAKGTLAQHGFARNLPWELVSTKTEDDARATLRLASNDETRRNFPWEFVAEYTYILRGTTLRIEQRFMNTSDASASGAMEFGAGFHPYFHVKQSEKGAARVGTAATRAFDNVTKKEIAIEGPIDLARKEVDLHLLDHGANPISLSPAGVTLRGSSEFSHWVVWTLEGKDFVCVEPWTCPGNALNTHERLIALQPGESRTVWIEISSS
jgi:galactose mutarotase-like enzyme